MAGKQYASPEFYETKLKKVMERFEIKQGQYDYNWDRHGCWIQFTYRGQQFRFDHSIAKAKAKGVNLKYGSDAFAQVVLALEDLARLTERGIYDLSTWLAGMVFLEPPKVIPEYFRFMGFTKIPADAAEVRDRYRTLAKQWHPDNPETGNAEMFKQLSVESEKAIKHFEKT
ncbi:DnaJ domain-containing protein [Bacillus cereus]|nr:DnaJ domain-containing protein [Bacillus cereus]